MNAHAWRVNADEEKYIDCVQFDGFKGKRKANKLLKMMTEQWRIVAEGFNPKNSELTYIFSREFDDTKQWREWAKQFPMTLLETTSHGNIRTY